jgi:putative transposase
MLLTLAVDAIFYVLKSGCHWRLLPHDVPPWSTVYYHFRRFRLNGLWSLILKALHTAERNRAGKDHQPTAAIIDSQSVKTVEESAHPRGYDAHKRTSKRAQASPPGGHPGASDLGVPHLGRCSRQGRGAVCSGRALKPFVPRLKKIWADGAYAGEKLAGWLEEQSGWELEVVERDREAKGFEVSPKRWIVERTCSLLIRNRRLSKDYERLVQTSETFIEVAMIRLILRRLARGM